MAKEILAIDAVCDVLKLKYANNKPLRCLAQLVPLLPALDAYIMIDVERIRADRLRTFFEELATGEIELTEEIISSEDFLHCFFITSNAVLKTRHRAKIVLFAKLLKSSIAEPAIRNTDEYEEFCQILTELSFEEWQALLILDSYENSPREQNNDSFQWACKFWPRFVSELTERIGIPDGEVIFFVNRIERTGLYNEFIGGYLNYTRGVGHLTPRFDRFKRLLKLNAL